MLGVSAWGLFMVFVKNQEKLSSSIMQQLMTTVRESPELREVLGEAIRPEPEWWMNGDPWINGAVRIGAFVAIRMYGLMTFEDPHTWREH